jgi:hypothetical protein
MNNKSKTKYPTSVLNSIREVNGIFNKEFYGFDKNTLKLLEKAEGVECKTLYLTKYEDIAKVLTKDNREYLIFQDIKSANEYAIDLGARLEDDPYTLNAMKKLGRTPEQYYTNRVFVSGAEYVLSFDQTHKLTLSNGMVAYRTQ